MTAQVTPDVIARSGTEHAHQTALFCQIQLNRDEFPELTKAFAIPNGGLRDKITAAKLKAEGVRAGVADVFLPVARHGFHGLFIEMKRPGELNATSAEQKKFLASMRDEHYAASVCDNWLSAWQLMVAYLRGYQ